VAYSKKTNWTVTAKYVNAIVTPDFYAALTMSTQVLYSGDVPGTGWPWIQVKFAQLLLLMMSLLMMKLLMMKFDAFLGG